MSIDIDTYFNDNHTNIENNAKSDELIVGIDLGCVNSCISVWQKNDYKIIHDINGNNTIPSVVGFTSRSKYVGHEAKKQIELNPENTFYDVKRLIGKEYNDDIVQSDIEMLTYKVVSGDENNILLHCPARNKKFMPEEITAMILSELKQVAENYLQCSVNKVVITIPAYFNDNQRQATQLASRIAGLECVRMINEPTASALAYGLLEKSKLRNKDINVLIYDLGGSTMDISILNISDGVFQVITSAGNTHLGGIDFDNKIVEYSLKEFNKINSLSVDISDLNLVSLQKLKQACENAKIKLSQTKKTIIQVIDFYNNIDLRVSLTRKEFELLCNDLFTLCLKSVDEAIECSELHKEDIDEIVLVGGMTQIPLIRNNLRMYFNNKSLNCSLNPNEVVAIGAGLQGYLLNNNNDPFSENVILLDSVALSLGIETHGGLMNVIIPRNSTIPIKKKKKYTTTLDDETTVNIKIYQGERKMVKDNIMIGEFTLGNLEPLPRGVHKIEVCFSIDVNGIVSVIAEDLRNPLNKSNITINNSKNLSPDKIEQIIREAQENDIQDKLERDKRQIQYQIQDMHDTIMENINSTEYHINEVDKKTTLEELEHILSKLENFTKEELFSIVDNIKSKYATLILKPINDNNNITPANICTTTITTTNIYDDNEEEIIHESLNETNKEIKQAHDTLVNLCYDIFGALGSGKMKLKEKHMIELKNYIDDALLWTFVKDNIALTEYEEKINEINNLCNSIYEEY